MKVAVIVVTYNGMKWIEECIQGLLDSTMKVAVIIVDNNSSDETVPFIKGKFGTQVHLIESKVNLGFGKGNNLGIKYSLTLEPDYVFLLNQDAFVSSNTIGKLVEIAAENPNYGIVSPIQLNRDGTALEWYFSYFMEMQAAPDFYSDFVLRNSIKPIYETSFVNAASWLIPKKVLTEIGGFDPEFWHYGEDDNYCQRIQYHGYKIGVVPDSFIRHDSVKRVKSDSYLFSERYFQDYIMWLQVKYGNINKAVDARAIVKEKTAIKNKIVKSILGLDFHKIKNYKRQYNLIDATFKGIFKSREINKTIGQHYL